MQPTYLSKHVISRDPFECIDVRGVGSLINLAITKAKKANPTIKVKYYWSVS
jgi:hypothetical protein